MTRMRRLVYLILTMLLVGCPCTSWAGERVDTLSVMFWNLENFFDYRDGGTSVSDREFSSFGERHWTKSRFYAKCNAVAKAILWAASEYGRMPDVIGFAEVENRFVVSSVVGATLLRKYDYGIVHYDSSDPRGIDVALIYRKSVFGNHTSRPVRIKEFRTRDILYVRLEYAEGGRGEEDGDGCLHFLVNHHPSKFGGAAISAPRRKVAMRTMLEVCDSIRKSEPGAKIICMGDFNDVPDNPLFDFSGTGMVNIAGPLAEKGEGTIRYQGKRDMIDMFIVSRCIAKHAEMEVCRIPFLTVWDSTYSGEKPFRTYSGPRYIGGVSDHCPIWMELAMQ